MGRVGHVYCLWVLYVLDCHSEGWWQRWSMFDMTFISAYINHSQQLQRIPRLWVQKTGFTGLMNQSRTVHNGSSWMRGSVAECSNLRKYKTWVYCVTNEVWLCKYESYLENHGMCEVCSCRKFSSGLLDCGSVS